MVGWAIASWSESEFSDSGFLRNRIWFKIVLVNFVGTRMRWVHIAYSHSLLASNTSNDNGEVRVRFSRGSQRRRLNVRCLSRSGLAMIQTRLSHVYCSGAPASLKKKAP
jgi:hypothetical protein